MEENPRKKARLDAGLSVAEVAAKAGMAPSYYREFESGRRRFPDVDTALLLAEILGCDPKVFLPDPDIPGRRKRTVLGGMHV